MPFSKGRSIEKFVDKSEVFQKSHTGLHLIDAETGRVLVAVNSSKYFTPASNTKILTLATCLGMLGDSLIGAERCRTDSALYLRGSGDPTFMHPDFSAWQPVFRYITEVSGDQPLKAIVRTDLISRLGPGWAWDDANYRFSAERTGWPAYGGVIRYVDTGVDTLFEPGFYKPMLIPSSVKHYRYIRYAQDPGTELLAYPEFEDEKPDTAYQAVHFASSLPYFALEAYMERILDNKIDQTQMDWLPVYSCPVDTAFRRMMHQSDNFISEHLLIMCSGLLGDTLEPEKAIQFALDSIMPASTSPPRWVDGSGLSRYNLVTPEYLTSVLRMLWQNEPEERILDLFPTGGKQGTLSKLYGGKPDYVFAKSGSMSGVYCLSGYLKTRSGRTLIFSIMHNKFVDRIHPWKLETQRLLEEVRDRY